MSFPTALCRALKMLIIYDKCRSLRVSDDEQHSIRAGWLQFVEMAVYEGSADLKQCLPCASILELPVDKLSAEVLMRSQLGPLDLQLDLEPEGKHLDLRMNVHVNSATAQQISRRMNDMADVISEANETDQDDLGFAAAMQSFQETLDTTRRILQSFTGRSFLSQLIHHQRDKDRLVAHADVLRSAFQVLLLQMRISNSAFAAGLASRLDAISTNIDASLDEGSPAQNTPHLPPQPHLRFGRAAETAAVVESITGDASGRVAVLGGPGIGKTTLVLAALHNPAVKERYGEMMFFIACDSAEGKTNCLAALVSSAFGVISSEIGIMRQTLQRSIGGSPAVLVLDNFESAWECKDQRLHAENVLEALATIPNLAIIVTLRGTERPAGMARTRPFLPPLSPLSDAAATQAFLSIADVPDSQSGSMETLLQHTGNIPLAIILLATLAQSQSVETLLQQWVAEETKMMVRGAGDDRRSSLGLSIWISLQSARMRAAPVAQTLLSLLSLLPNGATDSDIIHWGIDNARRGIAVLLQTALATRGTGHRIHVLAPIRDYMLVEHPPPDGGAGPLFDHYLNVADIAIPRSQPYTLGATLFPVVKPEIGNIESIVCYLLRRSKRDLRQSAVDAVVNLC
ncbi:hypothetical protein AURDEDRAFT_163394 [Auricularia subglabra TFB-10046 SS5]|nr:hypothetical protein AURDEDRAFT_163394 [Auricularia subglabra TFB-10046 SS5]